MGVKKRKTHRTQGKGERSANPLVCLHRRCSIQVLMPVSVVWCSNSERDVVTTKVQTHSCFPPNRNVSPVGQSENGRIWSLRAFVGSLISQKGASCAQISNLKAVAGKDDGKQNRVKRCTLQPKAPPSTPVPSWSFYEALAWAPPDWIRPNFHS